MKRVKDTLWLILGSLLLVNLCVNSGVAVISMNVWLTCLGLLV